MQPTNIGYQKGLEVGVPGLQTEGLKEKGRNGNETTPEQGNNQSKQSSSTDQAQITEQLSQGQGWLETEGVLKGKLQRAAHAKAAAAVGLCWPEHRNRTATALLVWAGIVSSRRKDQGRKVIAHRQPSVMSGFTQQQVGPDSAASAWPQQAPSL